MYPKRMKNNFFDRLKVEFTKAHVIIIMRGNFLFQHDKSKGNLGFSKECINIHICVGMMSLLNVMKIQTKYANEYGRST